MSKLIHSRTSVYNIGYHMVWSVKYRRPVIIGKIAKALREILQKIAIEKGFSIKEIELMPDHIHVFVSAKPKISPSYIYKMLKGISSRRLLILHPEIKKKLWGKHFWNPSTYIETIGHISQETIEKYIREQKKR